VGAVTNQSTEDLGASTTPARSEARRSIDLDIAGGNLMLRGHFQVWESRLALGPDLDRVGVRLAVDATSSARPLPTDAGQPLFAFHSRSVEPEGPGGYRAHGIFTGAQGARPLDVAIETPLGHTALFMLAFGADRQDFGEHGWGALVENVAPSTGAAEGDPVRAAHAWLLPPVLAAA
jgi:hypothetical protein